MNKLNLKRSEQIWNYCLFIYFLDFHKAYGILFWIPGVPEYKSVILRSKKKPSETYRLECCFLLPEVSKGRGENI